MNNEKMHALVTLANDIRVGLFRLEDNRDLFDKLEGLGVELLGFFDEKISALLKWDSVAHHPIIAVNDQDSEKRQLFSLAHEIGHLFIDYGWLPEPHKAQNDFDQLDGVLNVTHYRHDARDMQREALMDDFSRNFLMPFDEVKAKYIDNGMQAEKTIDALVERYYVSELAARTQLGFVKKVWGEEW